MYRKLAAWLSAGSGSMMPPPAAMRPAVATIVAKLAVNTTLVRYRPSGDMVFAPGSKCASADDERPKHVHAIRRRERTHQAQHAFRQAVAPPQAAIAPRPAPTGLEASVPQQVADFLERRMLGKIVDVVAAIGQHSPLTIQIADRRRRNDDVLETGFCGGYRCVATGLDDSQDRDRRYRRPWTTDHDYWLSDTCVLSTTLSPAELLDDREEAGIQEADLEQHEERQRAVNAVGECVEDGRSEVEPEP